MGISTAVLVATVMAVNFIIFRKPIQIDEPLTLPFTLKNCRELPTGRDKYRCYAANALVTADISWCKRIPFNFCEIDPVGNQYQNCLYVVAYTYNKPEICSLISHDSGECDSDTLRWRNDCFVDLATKLHEEELCRKITTDVMKAQICHDNIRARRIYPDTWKLP